MLELNKIYNCDCLDGMRKLDNDSIDLILQDPPYNTTACKWEWDIMIKIEEFWTQWKRIIKPNGAIVMTASQPFTSKMVMSNLKMFKYEWIWCKSRAVGFPNAKNKPMNKHENIVVFSKGDCANRCKNLMRYNPQGLVEINKKVNGTKACKGDINGHGFARPSHKKERVQQYTNFPNTQLTIPNDGNTIHPTQKPIALFEYLVRTYTNEGDTVFDGFIGSGTTAIACIRTNRNYIGMELNLEYVKISQERVKNELSQLKLDL